MMLQKRLLTATALLAVYAILACASGAMGGVPEYIPDSHTVLLDHLNGSTLAEHENGPISYVPSVPDLNLAANIGLGNWLRYQLPAWNSPQGGTLEMWVNPSVATNSYTFTLQWFKVDSIPPAGFIGGYDFHTGLFHAGVWAQGELWSNTIVQPGQWIHLAFEWSPWGSGLFVNGEKKAVTSQNLYPHMSDPLYVYINGWGGQGLGYIDEIRISNISRHIPLPPAVFLLGSGLIGLMGLGKMARKR